MTVAFSGKVWVFGDTITKGMELEIARAQHRDQPIRYFTNDFEEVYQ